MRIRDWRIALLFLVFCGLCEMAFAGSPNSTPLLPHKDQADEKEFQAIYQNIQRLPTINSGAGAPSYTPKKIGDIFISTTTSVIYMATGTVNSGSWEQI